MENPSTDHTKAYYDEFAARYEAERRPNDPYGYHAMLDDLEVPLVKRYGAGKDILEAGCGTGLLLSEFARFAKTATGFDLSPGMLAKATARGLTVKEGSVTDIPFPDNSFDVVCSFKVLAHVPAVRIALSEMARVTRPGGVIIAELYNPYSFRGLAKRLGPAGKISDNRTEAEVFTRFDSPRAAQDFIPPGCRFETERGIRIVTPTASALRIPGLRQVLPLVERLVCDTPLAKLGGFYVVVARKSA